MWLVSGVPISISVRLWRHDDMRHAVIFMRDAYWVAPDVYDDTAKIHEYGPFESLEAAQAACVLIDTSLAAGESK